jgi:hypothetical protein
LSDKLTTTALVGVTLVLASVEASVLVFERGMFVKALAHLLRHKGDSQR